MSSFQFEQIGVIRSPYKEKFAVPRQPGLVKSANGELHLIAPYNQADAVRGLEAFSHLWIDLTDDGDSVFRQERWVCVP